MDQQISYLTVIVVHSTMHLMHHNHCQITTMCVCVCVCVCFVAWVTILCYMILHALARLYIYTIQLDHTGSMFVVQY